jgi:hypothetical protein
MGAYCMHARIPRHKAEVGEVMEVRALPSLPGDPQVALIGAREEIACIPHKGCRLEIVSTAPSFHRRVDLLLPGQVLEYKQSFFFGDRVWLPGGPKTPLHHLVGFKLQLLGAATPPPPVEEAIVADSRRQRALEEQRLG